MSEITILHNPRCSKSRQAVSLASELGVEVSVRKYLDEPLSVAELESLIGRLDGDVLALVRRDANFKAAGLSAADIEDAAAVVKVLTEHPNLLERPVLMTDKRAVIGRPTEAAESFLKESH